MLHTLLWYHGTSVRYLDQIAREGLRPLSENGLDPAHPPQLCVSTHWPVALAHARLMAEYEQCAPVIWCVLANTVPPTAFGLDHTVLRLGPSGDPTAPAIAAWRAWQRSGITPTPEQLWQQTGHGSINCTVSFAHLVPVWPQGKGRRT